MTLIAFLSFLAWLGLTYARHQFWRADRRIEATVVEGGEGDWPDVLILIPARDEGAVIDLALRSHIEQRYPGRARVVVIDDHSEDDTAAKAEAAAAGAADDAPAIEVIKAADLPAGWTGKLWALQSGLDHALKDGDSYVLLCDADVALDPGALRALVSKAEAEERDLVSVMARLKTEGFWADLLIPAYVYFFQLLYPFPAVNDRARRDAAAAGGCALVRASALKEAGGFQAWRSALIDDCAMARAVKRRRAGPPYRPIWLGLSRSVRSLRAYEDLNAIWSLVTRTAYEQLDRSRLKLSGAILAMAFAFLIPPVAALFGLSGGGFAPFLWGSAAFFLMARSYVPTLTLYDQAVWRSVGLPVAAGLYMGMTIDSALRDARGRGGEWKGRTHGATKVEDPA